MLEKTRKELIANLIKEISNDYSLKESIVIEELCKSLSEVLSEEFPYKIETFFRNGEIFFIGRIFQHGREIDVALSISKLKNSHLAKAHQLLSKRLDLEEYGQNFLKCIGMINTIVYGKIEKILNDYVIVTLDNTDIQGRCSLSEMRINNESDLIDKRFLFHITNISQERLDKRFRFVFNLSRNAKQTPAMLIKQLANDNELIIKCARRMPGKTSYLKSNKPIKKKILLKAEKELQGEAIRIRPMEASNGRS